MNGPEHYAKAEKLIEATLDPTITDEQGVFLLPALLGKAQVHATLALTAAIADTRTEILWREDGGGMASISLTERDVHYQNGPEPGTWADVIRSTVGDAL